MKSTGGKVLIAAVTAAVTAMVTLAGCGSAERTSSGSVAESVPTIAPTLAPNVAPNDTGATTPSVLDFTAALVGGGEFDGASAAGRPTAFWFWAPT